MTALAPADIVAVWELGSQRPDWNRALIVLAPVFPLARPSELAALSIGVRNAHLLRLREATIGPVMQALVKCPKCGEPLEFEQRIDELTDDYVEPVEVEYLFVSGDYAVRYRLLTSEDLQHAAQDSTESAARQSLATRAVIEARHGGTPVAAGALPDAVLALLGDDMAANDPLADLSIPLACAACEHVWAASFEIVSFLWSEIDRKARRILEDVVALAKGYGWSEGDILAMSPVRRQYYLDAIG